MGNNSGIRGCFGDITTGCLANVLGALTLSIIAVIALKLGISAPASGDSNVPIVFPTQVPLRATSVIPATNNSGVVPALDPVTQNTDVVLSGRLDRAGCAVAIKTLFGVTDPIYVVLNNASFPKGTRFFARLSKENLPLEDSAELVADQVYTNTCVHFVFELTDSSIMWEEGNYKIELYINGSIYRAVGFEIR